MLNAAATKTDSLSRWAIQLRERRGYWLAINGQEFLPRMLVGEYQ
jgi:hypothetical protein